MADNSIRHQIAVEIMRGLDDSPQVLDHDYDPDQIHICADRVIALLMSKLTGQIYTAEHHPTIIGPAEFKSDGIRY